MAVAQPGGAILAPLISSWIWLNSPASSQTPSHLGHWSISTFFVSENHFLSRTVSGQRGHLRGSVSLTLLTGTDQIECKVLAALALTRSTSRASS